MGITELPVGVMNNRIFQIFDVWTAIMSLLIIISTVLCRMKI